MTTLEYMGGMLQGESKDALERILAACRLGKPNPKSVLSFVPYDWGINKK